ncbi:MAG: hypothetical protein JETCAE03_33210 [Ignavibacteriaceae bacterium]|nr:MAG: hypothetical protein JETCAE03_33210 [Ignavibacteriaceae bacterium]
MNKSFLSQWTSTFFGLPTDYRPKLWAEIFDLAYYSNGGFHHDEIYNMPTTRRKFYLKLLAKKKEDEKTEAKKPQQGVKPNVPNVPQVRRKKP